MLAVSESYFIKEIKFALQRQEQNWSEYLFMVLVFFSVTPIKNWLHSAILTTSICAMTKTWNV